MIAIINYGLGNLRSVKKAFDRIGVPSVITSDLATIEHASKVVIPGVGHFRNGMNNLKESGLIDVLNAKALVHRVPVLGICLGMQLMTEWSDEANTDGLGWAKAKTLSFAGRVTRSTTKIPHMGWNSLLIGRPHALFEQIDTDETYYFVHSYYVSCSDPDISISKTEYDLIFDSGFCQHNIFGLQFHPEKSHDSGLQILRNFSRL